MTKSQKQSRDVQIASNIICGCGENYTYKPWEDDEKRCPECGELYE